MTHASMQVPVLPADLKLTNRFQVISPFLSGQAHSATEISEEIGLSRQTVMKSIQFFLNKGILSSAGKGVSTNVGGKRPELFNLSKDRFFLCITLWPQEARLSLYTIGGKLLDQISLIESLPADPRLAVDTAGERAKALLRKNSIPLENVKAVSLSTAGVIDYKTVRLRYSSLSPEWGTDVPLGDYLRPHFAPGTMIFLENAGKMTARPFLLEPELAGKRILVLFCCWGLSGCLIEKDHILSGKNSLIGEFGHMIIDPDDPEQCGCGSHGCFERQVSQSRVQTILRREAPNYPGSPLCQVPTDQVTIPRVFAASAAGDGLGLCLSQGLARVFARALRNIALVFDPDLVVFQGDYATADPSFDRALRQELASFQYFPEGGAFDIRYDRRPLAEMDSLGSYIALSRAYFGNPALYEGD